MALTQTGSAIMIQAISDALTQTGKVIMIQVINDALTHTCSGALTMPTSETWPVPHAPFWLKLSRSAMWLTYVASTATHCIIQYSTDAERVQGWVCHEAVAACGFDLRAIENALHDGERVASKFMSSGI